MLGVLACIRKYFSRKMFWRIFPLPMMWELRENSILFFLPLFTLNAQTFNNSLRTVYLIIFLIPDSGGKLPMLNILTRLWPLNLWAIGKVQRSLSPNRPLTLLHCLLIISHRKITVMNMSLCSSPFQAPGGSVKKRRCQSKIYRQSRSPIWDQTLNTKLELVSIL